MLFIDFQFKEDMNGKPIIPESCLLLRQRRNELGLTQQQVASAAHITTQQYQRLESGERKLENSSLKVGIPVCLVLRISPAIFFPDAEEMNAFVDKSGSRTTMTEEEILRIASTVFERYNDCFGTQYSLENIKIAFCTLDNAKEVYRSFTSTYDFHFERRPTFSDFGAEAFIGPTDCGSPDHVDGILVRTDVPLEIDNARSYMMLFVRELAQIFCTTHEIPTAHIEGQRFFDLYCAGTPRNREETVADGQINAGYAIWRQFIADIVADIVYQQPSMYLREIKTEIERKAQMVKVGNPDAKEAMYSILAMVMNTFEGGRAETWKELEAHLREEDIPFIQIIHLVYDQLHSECAYRIEPDFIRELGTVYMLAQIQNTSQEDIMAFMGRHG